MPVREKRPKGLASGPTRVLSRPGGGAHRPKPRARWRTASKFSAERDCLLEGTGFEPSVPRDTTHFSRGLMSALLDSR